MKPRLTPLDWCGMGALVLAVALAASMIEPGASSQGAQPARTTYPAVRWPDDSLWPDGAYSGVVELLPAAADGGECGCIPLYPPCSQPCSGCCPGGCKPPPPNPTGAR